MELFSDDGRIKLTTTNWAATVRGPGIGDRKQLGSIGRISLAAVSNSGRFVAISPQDDKAVQVYRWSGTRWSVEADYDFPVLPAFLAWDEEAWMPQLSVRLADRSRHIIYEWSDHWICQEC